MGCLERVRKFHDLAIIAEINAHPQLPTSLLFHKQNARHLITVLIKSYKISFKKPTDLILDIVIHLGNKPPDRLFKRSKTDLKRQPMVC